MCVGSSSEIGSFPKHRVGIAVWNPRKEHVSTVIIQQWNDSCLTIQISQNPWLVTFVLVHLRHTNTKFGMLHLHNIGCIIAQDLFQNDDLRLLTGTQLVLHHSTVMTACSMSTGRCPITWIALPRCCRIIVAARSATL